MDFQRLTLVLSPMLSCPQACKLNQIGIREWEGKHRGESDNFDNAIAKCRVVQGHSYPVGATMIFPPWWSCLNRGAATDSESLLPLANGRDQYALPLTATVPGQLAAWADGPGLVFFLPWHCSWEARDGSPSPRHLWSPDQQESSDCGFSHFCTVWKNILITRTNRYSLLQPAIWNLILGTLAACSAGAYGMEKFPPPPSFVCLLSCMQRIRHLPFPPCCYSI